MEEKIRVSGAVNRQNKRDAAENRRPFGGFGHVGDNVQIRPCRKCRCAVLSTPCRNWGYRQKKTAQDNPCRPQKPCLIVSLRERGCGTSRTYCAELHALRELGFCRLYSRNNLVPAEYFEHREQVWAASLSRYGVADNLEIFVRLAPRLFRHFADGVVD